MAKTVADNLIERLIDWGVRQFLASPATASTAFSRRCAPPGQDPVHSGAPEEAAAFAACGHAKYTGTLGVCLATSGPGGIHLLNGLYDAKCDGQPVLAIAGHTFSDLINTHYQQDVDLEQVVHGRGRLQQRVNGPAHLPNVVDEAIRTAFLAAASPASASLKTFRNGGLDSHRSGDNVAHHSMGGYAANRGAAGGRLAEAGRRPHQRRQKVAILAGRGSLGRQRNRAIGRKSRRTGGEAVARQGRHP